MKTHVLYVYLPGQGGGRGDEKSAELDQSREFNNPVGRDWHRNAFPALVGDEKIQQTNKFSRG